MWHLKIDCIAALVACFINPTPAPNVQREFNTLAECDKVLMQIATRWQPAQGAWTLNCVKR